MIVPDDPRELGLAHPFWRKFQKQTVEKVLESKKRFVIVEAPTGSGKTAIAIAAASLMKKKTTILTHTLRLQQQYLHECPTAILASGKSSYKCLINDEYRVSEAPCNVGWQCRKKKICDYFIDKTKVASKQTPLAVTNYSYWISNTSLEGGEGLAQNTEFLVCDEGHLAELVLMSQVQIVLLRKEIEHLHIKFPESLPTIQDAINWAQIVEPDLTRQNLELTSYICNLPEESIFSKMGLFREIKRTKDVLRQVEKLLNMESIEGEDGHSNMFWIVDESPNRYEFKPIWAHSLKEHLFCGVSKVLIQSATFPETMVKYLGLKAEEYDYIEVPSTFPKENRPIYYWPVAYLKMGSPESEIIKVTKAIDSIIDSWGQSKGMIHTGNFTFLKKIKEYSRHANRFITHENCSAIEAMDKFRESSDGLLVSPSMTSGVDFPYEACEFQIIAKIPFPDLGDPQIKARRETQEGRDWYSNTTLFTVEQTYGRVMRAEDDHGVTYILDSNFSRFYSMNIGNFSEHFREAVFKIDDLLEASKL